jgi:NitT/TauT family transport system ATP-binding protein
MDVNHGEFVSIVGPSGAGKTTLLKVIGGLVQPTSGDVLIDGSVPEKAQQKKSIGFVFQEGNLLPWRNVSQNVRLPLEINPQIDSGSAQRPEDVIEAVGLADFANYYPRQLSGGMKQRTALARALVLNPSILLMDEPLGSLDELTRSEMRYEILRLWEKSGKTVIFITHSIAEAVILSDRVITMSSRPGRIVADLRIELPRPRDESLEFSADFQSYVYSVKKTLSMAA